MALLGLPPFEGLLAVEAHARSATMPVCSRGGGMFEPTTLGLMAPPRCCGGFLGSVWTSSVKVRSVSHAMSPQYPPEDPTAKPLEWRGSKRGSLSAQRCS